MMTTTNTDGLLTLSFLLAALEEDFAAGLITVAEFKKQEAELEEAYGEAA